MRYFKWLILGSMALMTVSCWKTNDNIKAIERRVTLTQVDTFQRIHYIFTGAVYASENTNLSFQVGGPIMTLNVDAGEWVTKGTVIATIDPQDYEELVSGTKAAYVNSQSQLERNKRLLERQAISKQEYEQSVAGAAMAKDKYEDALQQLHDTKLVVPFDGFIVKKFVENYQKVQAGTAIVQIMNPGQIEVRFLVPETKIRLTQLPLEIALEFDNYKGQWFTAAVKDIVQASPDGSGIPLTVIVDDKEFNPEKYKIYPGFSCKVKVSILKPIPSSYIVPLCAVMGAMDSNETFVWIYNSEKGVVNRRNIEVIQLVGKEDIMIKGNITPQEQLVLLGGTFLTEGDKVVVIK
ncbi:MAG: efflux RND transporter periplasmic adaptor subunit [Marinifilaceae bacterium]